MTTIEYDGAAVDTTRTETPRGGSWIGRLFAGIKRRHQQRLTLATLSHMDARLLRDIGIEPMDVENALSGINRSALFSPFRDNRGL
jgi:uncharacterized protein YjiS (DUF1127 family)